MKGYNRKKLTERQKIAERLLDSCKEELMVAGQCESCEKSGYAYVEFAGTFSDYCAFLDSFADEIEKTSRELRLEAFRLVDDAIKDDVIRNNLDIISEQTINCLLAAKKDRDGRLVATLPKDLEEKAIYMAKLNKIIRKKEM